MKPSQARARLAKATTLCFALAAPAAHGAVNIFGVVNEGVGYVSNVKGHSLISNNSGNLQGSRFGFTGTEDLGAGYKALFWLENGFGVDNGAIQQGGRLFGRQAYVGLGTPIGTVTFGRQYDFMFDMGRFSSGSFAGYGWRPQTAGLLTGSNGSTIDTDRLGGARVDNAVKFVTTPLGGLSFGALYGLDEKTGAGPGAGHTLSLTAKYVDGPWAAAATYTSLTDPTGSLTPAQGGVGAGAYRNFALGLSRSLGQLTLAALLTENRWTGNGDRTRSFEIDARYNLTPALMVGAGWIHIVPNHGNDNIILKGVRNQLTWIVDYALSKRTDVYLTGAFQSAGGGNQAFIYNSGGPSTSGRQTAVEAGLRHKF